MKLHRGDTGFFGRPSFLSRASWRRLQAIAIAFLLLLPITAHAQSVSIDLGAAGQGGATSRIVQLTALVTVLSLAPSLLVMVTAFTRIVIVLSLLRSALGAQGVPPNTVLIGLALFLTWFVMQPVFEHAWAAGILPMMDNKIGEIDGLQAAAEPFRDFMLHNLRGGDLGFFQNLAHAPVDDKSWRVVMPAGKRTSQSPFSRAFCARHPQ